MSIDIDRSTWKRLKLGDVVKQVKDKVDPEKSGLTRYVAGEHMDTDELRIRRWGTISTDYLGPAFHMRFRPGQVLYGSRRTYLRKVALADFDGICANTTFVLEPLDEGVLLRAFLPFIISTEAFHAYSKSESKGSVNPYVNWSDIARYEFDLPPLDEQTRIADLLWATDSLRTNSSILRTEIEEVRAAFMRDALSGVAETVPLRDVAQLIQGRSVPSDLYRPEGVRLIRAGDLHRSGFVVWSEKSVCLPGDIAGQRPQMLLKPGDLVINMTAQTLDDAFLGRTCTVQDECLLNQRIGKVVPLGGFRLDVLRWVLADREFTRWVARRAEGSKVKHMHWRHIESYPVPVLSIRQWEEFLERMGSLTKANDAARSSEWQSNGLRRTLLQILRSGA